MEQVVNGITRELYFNDRLAVYNVQTLTSSVLSVWSQTIAVSLTSLPQGQNYYAIHDLSAPGAALAFYNMTSFNLNNPGVGIFGTLQLDRMFEAQPNFQVFLGLVLSPRLSGQIVVDHNQIRPQLHRQITHKTFIDKSSALKWMESIIDEPDLETNAHLGL